MWTRDSLFLVVWNTFERDWWESFKPVNGTGLNDKQTSSAPMTFAHEWYALIPSSNTLSNPKSLQNGNAFKTSILNNGSNSTYFQGEENKFEANFYAQ